MKRREKKAKDDKLAAVRLGCFFLLVLLVDSRHKLLLLLLIDRSAMTVAHQLNAYEKIFDILLSEFRNYKSYPTATHVYVYVMGE